MTQIFFLLRRQVDFQDAEARTVAERRREEERQRRMERIYKERVEAASKDMEGEHQTGNAHISSSCKDVVLDTSCWSAVRQTRCCRFSRFSSDCISFQRCARKSRQR